MDRPKFGVEIPGFPLTTDQRLSFVEQTKNFLRDLESDYDSAWFMDHFQPWQPWAEKTADVLECYTAISHLSGVFRKFHFGSIVMCNSFRNPALLAKMGATLDALTGGRFILGIGAGWFEEEYRAYGYDFPKPIKRIRQLEEGVQIIRKMWNEEAVSFEGKYFKIANAYCNPKPSPPPPIMIGGKGKELLKVVARHADWWNSGNCTPETYSLRLDALRQSCVEANREFDDITKTMVNLAAVVESEEEAKKIVKKSRFPIDECYFVGSPEKVKNQIRAFTNLGVKHFILVFLDFPETNSAKLFAEKVIPEFR